jgi:hypothetical protein
MGGLTLARFLTRGLGLCCRILRTWLLPLSVERNTCKTVLRRLSILPGLKTPERTVENHVAGTFAPPLTNPGYL